MDRPIKVLHAITRLDRGGSSENTLLSVIGLARLGYKIDLLFGRTLEPNLLLLRKAREEGVEFIEAEDLVRDIHPFRDISAFSDIRRLISKGEYDIVHAHSSKAGLVCRIAAKACRGTRTVYTPHGHVFYGYFIKPMTYAIIMAEALLARGTDTIVGLTQSECEEWLGYGIGRREQYTAIPSGVDFRRLEKGLLAETGLREELGIPDNAVVVGGMGRFVEIKGFHYFLEAAFQQILERENVYFILAGDGPLWAKYKERIREEGCLDRFKMIGWQESAARVFTAIDIFVIPSINEGMGRVLVEAMYFRKPAIAAAVGGIPSVVDRNSGIPVPPGSADAIADAMDVLIDNPDLRRKMGEYARDKAINNFSYEKMIDDLDALYKRLLGRD